MSRLGEYTFISTNLLTGDIVSTVELDSLYWDEIYNSPGAGLATARIDHETTTLDNFKDFERALWAVKNDKIIWAGFVGQTQRRGGTRVLSIPIHGFFEYYRNRFLRNVQGMSYAQLVRISDIEWRNIDQFLIFQDYINHAHSVTDGDIGIGVVWDALSGKPQTSIRRTFTVKRIGEALEELIDTANGFSYRQVYSFVDGKPHCDFKLEYPHHANTLNTALTFQPEKQVLETTVLSSALDIDGTDNSYANGGDLTSVTGDLTVTAQLDPDDWTPSAIDCIRAKWLEATNQRSWRLLLLTDGKLRLQWSTDGTAGAVLTEDSDLPVSFTNGEVGTVQVILDVDNGNGDYEVSFFESSDGGATWDSLSNDPFESTFGVTF